MHPAVPDLLVREPVGVLQQKHADHEAYRLRRAAGVAKAVRQLLVEPGPVDPVGHGDKLVLHVDDLIEAGAAEKIVMARFVLLFRSHSNPQNQCLEGITNRPESESKSPENDRQNRVFWRTPILQISKNQRHINSLRVLHREQIRLRTRCGSPGVQMVV